MQQKNLSVCLLGAPNSGKSTLLNAIVGTKIAIVSPKVQTTRAVITGIVTLTDTQVVIFDTPGIFQPRNNFDKALIRSAWSSIHSADLVALMVDISKEIKKSTIQIIDRAISLNLQPILLINKIDKKSAERQAAEQFLSSHYPDLLKFEISALKKQGIESLLTHIKQSAKPGPWHYSADEMTSLPARFLASELTREQLFLNLDQELPYDITVEFEDWQEFDNGSVRISQVIYVKRESQKSIILGKGGQMLRRVGTNARRYIGQMLGKPVHLSLFVKVNPHWSRAIK